MVFFSSEEEHVKHVASVLQRIRENDLLAKASKCVFHASSVEYLGYVVSSNGLKMNSSKVQQILNQPQPNNIKVLQSFLGFANFYCNFIKNYSKQITALTSLLKKDSPYIFNEEALSQFQILKKAFTTAPILSHFNPSLPTIVETDASDYAMGAVLSQVNDLGKHPISFDSDLVDKIQNEVWQDKEYKEILKQLARGDSVTDYSLKPQAKLLLFKDRVVITSNEEIQLNILQKCHDSPLAGHPGQEKTLKPIKRDLFWAGMNLFIKDYMSSCQQFSRNKNIHHKKFGLLKPLQIPSVPWNSLSMDLITQLTLSNNFDSILAVVGRFSKMAIFIPTCGTINDLELAQILISHFFSKHGLPISIFSDRGSLFVSLFCTDLSQHLKISRDISTAFHPERDVQTERVNRII
ncbi:hypothetical protein O181_034770 [Austropuccinia psidii MF-1]|uniref:Integrase catalytic domain-containing protein n=1 Tax=Austropuccinia psidii MF-1 TaxID=1389203 RepID=A0A9Q3HAJ6_9BASI|nr:hypothetical protein [Austropuccinia psidii MF-1]